MKGRVQEGRARARSVPVTAITSSISTRENAGAFPATPSLPGGRMIWLFWEVGNIVLNQEVSYPRHQIGGISLQEQDSRPEQ